MKSIWYNGQVIKLGLIKTENYLIIGLRWSIALVFFWFGALKVFGYNPVDYIIEGTFPMISYKFIAPNYSSGFDWALSGYYAHFRSESGFDVSAVLSNSYIRGGVCY